MAIPVVQLGTGNVGIHSLRALITNPAFELTGVWVSSEAKAGKENEVAKFLETGLALANQEVTTPIWFALRLGPTTFGVFDAFTNVVATPGTRTTGSAAAGRRKRSATLSSSSARSRS